ncbi:MAG: hypothetical protein MRY83_24825 [Flavobacteriales bacterium]|nr:hypothetical protein [Flavobacteriales bacterium]
MIVAFDMGLKEEIKDEFEWVDLNDVLDDLKQSRPDLFANLGLFAVNLPVVYGNYEIIKSVFGFLFDFFSKKDQKLQPIRIREVSNLRELELDGNKFNAGTIEFSPVPDKLVTKKLLQLFNNERYLGHEQFYGEPLLQKMMLMRKLLKLHNGDIKLKPKSSDSHAYKLIITLPGK